MPQLKTFTADVGGTPISGGRRAVGGDFGGALVDVGRTVQGVLSDYQDQQEADDSRTVMVQSQELRADFAKRLADAELSGAPLDAIHEEFETANEQIAQTTRTRRGLETARMYGAESGDIFRRRSMDIAASREGAALKQDIIRSDAASSALLQNAPDMLPMLLADRDAIVDTYAGRVPPEVLIALKAEGAQQLAVASVNSLINSNPKMALAALKDADQSLAGWEVLTPESRVALVNAAEYAVKAEEADNDRAWRDSQRAIKLADDKAMDEMLQDFGGGKMKEWTRKRILLDGSVSPDMKLRMAQVLEAYTADEQKGNPAQYIRRYREIVAEAPGTRKNIDDDVISGRLNPEQHNNLLGVLSRENKPQSRIESQFFSRAEQLINPRDMLGAFMAPDGAMNSYRFMTSIMKIRDEWEQAGKDTAELFDPQSRAFATTIMPLLNHYRAKKLTVYEGGVAREISAQGSAGAPVPVVTQAEYDALLPGTSFTFVGEGPLKGRQGVKPGPKPTPAETRVPATTPAQAERAVREGGEMLAPERVLQPAKPLVYPPGFIAPGAEFLKPGAGVPPIVTPPVNPPRPSEKTFKNQAEEDAWFKSQGIK
jgi:hypothetical protein